MTQPQTDMVVHFPKAGRTLEYPVPEGFTVEEYADSLATAHPELANVKIINDGPKDDGREHYTLKPQSGDKG